MTPDLNIFGNVAFPDAELNMAPFALASARAAFGEMRARYFVDPNPNPDRIGPWIDRLRAAAPEIEVVETGGLADGFRRSVETAGSAHALQFEHDFVLLPKRIPHSFAEIAAAMAALGHDYLKFNKRWNRAAGYDFFMDEVPDAPVPCARIPGRSNNPHIIDVQVYRERAAPWIPLDATKAAGLEGLIELHVGGGLVYGALGHPATCRHLDGRRRRWRDAVWRRVYLAGRSARG